jgi:hypothetical protein
MNASVEVFDKVYAVEFTVYNEEQVEVKEVYYAERPVKEYTTREEMDEIESYLMHHYTNHIA